MKGAKSPARRTARAKSRESLQSADRPELLGARTVPASGMRQIGTLVDLVAGMPMNDPRYALFLGAGASVSSGIPSTAQLCTRWQRRVFLDSKRRTKWQISYADEFEHWKHNDYRLWRNGWEAANGRQPSDYSLLFSYAFPDLDGRQGFIERICAGCEPGPGYIYLAGLTLSGYFHTFLTTNFDELIHDSLFRYAGLKPVVCAFDSQVSSIRLQNPRPKVIKLHGDFLFSNIRSVGGEVAHLDRNMEEKFERTCESYGLIVVGYGGQDQSVMAPLLTMLHKRDCLAHGVHWCVYSARSKENSGSREIPEELYRMANQYPDKVHLYDMGTFDEVMESLFFGCRCAPPPELAQPEERALYTRLRDGIENADQTWRLTPRFSGLLGLFREARARKPPRVFDLLDKADQDHRDGQTKLDSRDFDSALLGFQSAIRSATEALGEASQPQKVRAFRRLSGSRGGICEIVVSRHRSQSSNSDSKPLAPSKAEEVIKLSRAAIGDVRKGLEIDSEIATPPDLRGHRLNLWYNGLGSVASLLGAGAKLSQAELLEALSWLENMAGDELYGDEYVRILAGDFGGAQLLTALRAFGQRH